MGRGRCQKAGSLALVRGNMDQDLRFAPPIFDFEPPVGIPPSLMAGFKGKPSKTPVSHFGESTPKEMEPQPDERGLQPGGMTKLAM